MPRSAWSAARPTRRLNTWHVPGGENFSPGLGILGTAARTAAEQAISLVRVRSASWPGGRFRGFARLTAGAPGSRCEDAGAAGRARRGNPHVYRHRNHRRHCHHRAHRLDAAQVIDPSAHAFRHDPATVKRSGIAAGPTGAGERDTALRPGFAARYLASPETKLMDVAIITAPNGNDSQACRSAVRLICLVSMLVSET